MEGVCVKVHIFGVPYYADCEYDYDVPPYLSDEVQRGSLVIVPFGKSNAQKTAVVTEIIQNSDTSSLKSVISVMNSYLSLDENMLKLCEYMKSHTLCTIGEAAKCMVPSVIVSQVNENLFVTDKNADKLSPDLSEIYLKIKNQNGISVKKITETFPSSKEKLIFLIKNKYITKKVSLCEKDKSKYENIVSLSVSEDEADEIISGNSKILKSEKHIAIIRALCEFGQMSDKSLFEFTNTQRTQLLALEKKGLLKIEKVAVMRDPYKDAKQTKKENIVLNEEQTVAFDSLAKLYHSNAPHGALLYGVTGSGKTSVIKKMIDEVISDNRSVIILVPEISLTPQTVSTFCGYYGDRVAVIHSNLSVGERFDAYKKIKDGEISVVIGTRSAVFAPLSNLGMIVIDEEQEHTYKSDTNPKYLAHDIARFRCASSNALMLLASATPSLNSYYKAMSGTYSLVTLKNRYGNATLPQVITVDMHRERSNGNMNVFSTKLASYLDDTVCNGKQAILFLNRRGYHNSISCQSCGKPIECPQCSVAMTYHSHKKINVEITAENAYEVLSSSGILRCHCCGYQMRLPKNCLSCGENDFNYIGFGTQKLEQDLSSLSPECKILRLDADTTSSKSSYEKILGSFLNGEANVLIGTQMVTKGHNFPSVTLVGVVLADSMLYSSDFRASERTFSMLTQVIGRAGRAKDKGVAIIQTNSPSEQTILLASAQDYDAFYKNEIQIRKAYSFPPYCDIALITVSSSDEKYLDITANGIIDKLKKDFTNANAPVIVYGPFEAPIYKMQGRYRKRIMVKCKLTSSVRKVFSDVICEFSKINAKSSISIDFNPSGL